MSMEVVKSSVAELHEKGVFSREKSKIRGGITALSIKLEDNGLKNSIWRCGIELSRLGCHLDDTNVVCIRLEEGEVVDPHHAVFDEVVRLAMRDYVMGYEEVSEQGRRVLRDSIDRLPDETMFPMGASFDQLQEAGVLYRPYVQLN